MAKTKIQWARLKNLPSERPLENGKNYFIENEDGSLSLYSVTSDGEPKFIRGVSADDAEKLSHLTVSLIDKLEEDYTKSQIDGITEALEQAIAEGVIQSTAGFVAPTGTVLPTPSTNNNFTIVGEGAYTGGGGIPAKAGYMRIARWNGTSYSVVGEVEMPVVTADGVVEEGDIRAVSGGEVYENIKSLDLLVLKEGTDIADELGVLNRDSENISKDVILLKTGSTAPSASYNTASFINITQDLDLKIYLYGANASICFYDSNNVLLEGYNKTDLGNSGLLTGNYLTAKISQITTNTNVKKFRFCFYANDNTIINEIKTTQDEPRNNTSSVLDFSSEQSINSKAIEDINSTVDDLQNNQNSLINELKELKLELEIEKESKQALFIEQTTFTSHWDTPNNPSVIIVPTDTTDNVLTGGFSIWGASKIINCAVKYASGKVVSMLIKSFTATTAIAESNFEEDVIGISSIYDAALGQHLSNLGYEAMGQRLFDFPKRYAFRQKLVKQIDFSHHSISGTSIIDTNTLLPVLQYTMLNSYPASWVNVVPSSISYEANITTKLDFVATTTAGHGISFDFTSSYIGYVELYLGTVLSAGEGKGKVQLIDKSTSLVIQEQEFYSRTKRILLNHGVGNYNIKIMTVDTTRVAMRLSSISFWEKRELSESIFKPTDRVLFFTDSWGEYPVTTNPAEYTVQFNGETRPGRCIMPKAFISKFVEAGGNAENVFLCVRGGFTSAWAKYWINEVISSVNPTKVVFHFAINDRNSVGNYPSTPSVYDFSSSSIFTQQTGGVFGSVDTQTYINNLVYLKETCISRGITPIFFMPPYVANTAQSQSLTNWNRDIYLKGF